ncbi:ABC transporter substrate-binding protein [Synechococcales cyanobacterium C]|uniref:ABC transporter substrate-binding protein n=1 Tax=Petrachloros mirabilis ULC683 TaxID=2781853 RepID=A0A8K2A9W3_9CYAN|nr:iron-siderophore ABC transporter substrate-binding protein [Petrachloros mirabilis]NCJ08620.1 ABC transporter substrate-binding protein [Petrachloros mirabilis ULC683]
MGETCVPANPQRVVVLDTSPLDAALTLGFKPIGSTNLNDWLSYSEEQLDGITEIGSGDQPNVEAILRLQPDLILDCGRLDQQFYEQLSRIAPTVSNSMDKCGSLPEQGADISWKQGFLNFAEALGKTEEATQLLDQYHQRIREFQQQMGVGAASAKENRLKQTDVSLVAAYDDSTQPARIYLENSFMGSVVAEAGLLRPPAQQKDDWVMNLSFERLDLIDADVMFVVEFPPDSLKEIQPHPLWSQLNVVKQGRIYPVHYGTWVAERSLGGASRILDDLFKHLLEEKS